MVAHLGAANKALALPDRHFEQRLLATGEAMATRFRPLLAFGTRRTVFSVRRVVFKVAYEGGHGQEPAMAAYVGDLAAKITPDGQVNLRIGSWDLQFGL